MAPLLRSSTDTINPSKISGFKSTHTFTATAILIKAADAAKEANAAKPPPFLPIEPKFQTRQEGQDEADRLNTATQAVIGVKEAVAWAITDKAGARVTDAVLRTADGADHRSIDEYEINKLINTLMQGAERTSITEVRNNIVV